MRIRSAVLTCMAFLVVSPNSVCAHWGPSDIENVPVARLLSNLESFETNLQPIQKADRAHIEFEIGRLHSMAYAQNTEIAQVEKIRVRPNPKWDSYKNDLKKRIAQNWKNRQKIKSTDTSVWVNISKDGKLLENKIDKSSGDDSIDNAAMAAVRATKLDPLPNWYDHDQIAFCIDFDDLLGSKSAEPPANLEPFYGHGPDFIQFKVKSTTQESNKKISQDHLADAIAHLEKALELDPSLLSARMGLGWCLDQAGKKERAIQLYREVFKAAYAKESRSKTGGLMGFSLADECGRYLSSLLKPTNDASELKDIQTKMNQVGQNFRAVTPLVIPLTITSDINALVDKAHVQFDLDGQGAKYCKSWITPKAGWLVFDKAGTGKVDSGLKLIGEVTFWILWKNAYEVLSALDDNHDGKLIGNELTHLAIWNDANGDGIAQTGEVQPLAYWHIKELACSYASAGNNLLLSSEGVTFEDGSRRPTYDVWIEQGPHRLARSNNN